MLAEHYATRRYQRTHGATELFHSQLRMIASMPIWPVIYRLLPPASPNLFLQMISSKPLQGRRLYRWLKFSKPVGYRSDSLTKISQFIRSISSRTLPFEPSSG